MMKCLVVHSGKSFTHCSVILPFVYLVWHSKRYYYYEREREREGGREGGREREGERERERVCVCVLDQTILCVYFTYLPSLTIACCVSFSMPLCVYSLRKFIACFLFNSLCLHVLSEVDSWCVAQGICTYIHTYTHHTCT